MKRIILAILFLMLLTGCGMEKKNQHIYDAVEENGDNIVLLNKNLIILAKALEEHNELMQTQHIEIFNTQKQLGTQIFATCRESEQSGEKK